MHTRKERSKPWHVLIILLATFSVCSAPAALRAWAQNFPPCFKLPIKLLSHMRLGTTIEDGLGYGGVQIGSSETELLTKWGETSCDTGRRSYVYGLESGEFVGVWIKDSKVHAMSFALPPHVSLASLALKTRKGIKLASPIEELRSKYGDPDLEKGDGKHRVALYTPAGVAFLLKTYQTTTYVYAIFIFKPGTPVDIAEFLP